MADSTKTECTGGENEGKDGESRHTGEDCTDSVILIERIVGENYTIPGSDQKVKRKTDALHHTGNCEIPSVSKKPKLVYNIDEPKVQKVEFHVRNISKISVEASVLEEQRKSTNHNESASSETPSCINPEGVVNDPEKMVINPEGAKAVDSKGTSVRFQLGYDPTSTEGVLKAVKSKEGHTISLDGNEISCPDTQFTEYKYELRYANGAPKDTIFFYECCKYPGYYIRWYCEQYAVNCEPCKSDRPHPLESQWQEFKWHRVQAKDIKGPLQYSRLAACMPNPPNILSPYFLTFQHAQPEIHQSIDEAAIFLITPDKSSGSSTE